VCVYGHSQLGSLPADHSAPASLCISQGNNQTDDMKSSAEARPANFKAKPAFP
jgi:hypothetical protein